MSAENKQCNRCLAGMMRVVSSRKVGATQVQRRECTQCDHVETVEIPRANVFPKDKKSTLDKRKVDIAARIVNDSKSRKKQ